MNYDVLQELIDEPNWYVRLWIGGSLYDCATTLLYPKPERQPEIYLYSPGSKLKNIRELLLDLHLLSVFKLVNNVSRRTEMLNMMKNNFW